MQDEKIILTETEASGGIKSQGLRYMLIASLLLVVAVFGALFYWVPFSVN